MRVRTSAPVVRVTALGAVLACAGALLTGPAARADTGGDKQLVDQQVQQLRDALEGTSTELANTYLALQQTQAQLPAAQAALAAAQATERAAKARNNEVATKLAVAKANEARSAEAVKANAAQLQATQSRLDNFAADLFQGGGSSQLAVALGATSADDFATRVVLADTVTAMTNDALHDLQNARAESQAQEAYLTAVRAEVAELKRQAEEALAAAKAAKAAAIVAKNNLEALVAKQTAYAQQVEARKADELNRLQAAEAEQARLQALLVEQARIARERAAAEAAAAAAAAAAEAAARAARGQPPAPAAPPPAGRAGGFLSYPVSGPVTSEFGQRFHPILLVWKLHSGTDFGVGCGTPVYAAADGVVLSAGWGGGNGNRVVIDHGMQGGVDLVTTYNHLESIAVGGGNVSRGQVIAYAGTTGYSTGCHLHFETLEDGTFVNPRKWL